MSHPQRRLSFRSHHLFAVDRDNLFRMQETDRQRSLAGRVTKESRSCHKVGSHPRHDAELTETTVGCMTWMADGIQSERTGPWAGKSPPAPESDRHLGTFALSPWNAKK